MLRQSGTIPTRPRGGRETLGEDGGIGVRSLSACCWSRRQGEQLLDVGDLAQQPLDAGHVVRLVLGCRAQVTVPGLAIVHADISIPPDGGIRLSGSDPGGSQMGDRGAPIQQCCTGM